MREIRVLVDADSCPVKTIISEAARKYELPLILFADTSHEIGGSYGKTVTVDKSADSADYAITAAVSAGDIVVTQDYGLAAMIMAKGAFGIHPSGMLYTEYNIDRLLTERQISAKIRKGGGRVKGPRKRTSADDESFRAAFIALVEERLNKDLR